MNTLPRYVIAAAIVLALAALVSFGMFAMYIAVHVYKS
jgi:hypothetical protein